MSTQVEEIKQKLDIVNVISHYVPIKKRGRHFVAPCPFHHEKTPSFVVSPEMQIFKCFGCGKAGDVYNFIQEFERVDFAESLEILAKEAGITLERSFQNNPQISQRKRLLDLHAQTQRFYHYLLTSHPLGKPALDYVLGRGITMATIKLFGIGFSPQNSSLLFNHLSKKGFKESELVSSGIFGKSQYGSRFYDRFSSRLTFPLSDARGQVLGFSGRSLPGAKADLAKYINSPETDLYHKSHLVFGLHLAREAIRQQGQVIVTEGEFDMIAPYQAGITNIVALKGTAFTVDQLTLLHRYADTLVLALDSDFAGSNAARKSIELADSMDFDIQVLDLGGKYKDPDEAVRADPAFFQQRLVSTLPIWDFLINSAVKIHGIDTPKGKRLVLANTLPSLVAINNSVIRSDYFRKLASIIGSDYDSVIAESQKFSSVTHPAPIVPAPVITSPSPTYKLEEYLLGLIFAAKQPRVVAQKITDDLSNFVTPVFQKLIHHFLATTDFDISTFTPHLPPELQPTFQQIYLLGTSRELESSTRRQEISRTLNQLRIINLKAKLSSLSSQISAQESASPDTDTSSLEAEYSQVLSQLSRLQTPKN